MSYHEPPDIEDYNPTTLSIPTAKDLLRTFQSTISDLSDDLGDSFDDDWSQTQIKAFNEFETSLSQLRGSIRITLHSLNQ